jgi:hypothetical protein
MTECTSSASGMTLTGENRRTGRKTRPSATLSTANPIQSGLRSNAGLRCDRSATNRRSRDTADKGSNLRVGTGSFSSQTLAAVQKNFLAGIRQDVNRQLQ